MNPKNDAKHVSLLLTWKVSRTHISGQKLLTFRFSCAFDEARLLITGQNSLPKLFTSLLYVFVY